MRHPVNLFSSIRGLSTFRQELKAGDKLILSCDEKYSVINKCFSVEVKKVLADSNEIAGHVAKEVSRFVYKWIMKSGNVEGKIYKTFWGSNNVEQKSFRAQGMEIGCVFTFEAEDTEHQNLLKRHFLQMVHKRDMNQELIGSFSGNNNLNKK